MQQRREEEGTVRDRDDYYADYDMPDAYERPLTRREKKERKKLARQERELRRRQAILEEKHRAAAEKEAARQARIQAKQDAEMARWEEKEARKQAKRDAKLAKKEEKLARKRRRKGIPDPEPAGAAGYAGTNAAAGTGASSTGKPARNGKAGKKATRKQTKASKKKEKEKRISAQKSIPYREMGRDGICRVQDRLYSKTIRFYDINYQLAQNEDKSAIFENWCDFLNYFDSTIYFQLSFINHKTNLTEFEKVIRIEPQDDEFDDVRMEYAQMLKDQLSRGNNGLMRTKYITFAIEADNIYEARPKLDRIEADILNNFKVLGVRAYPLNGVERLQILYETFNPEQAVPFSFQYDQLLKTGLSTKDFVAPTSFVFKSGKYFQMGGTLGAVSYLQILAPELTDKMLAEFLDMDKNLVVNLHIRSIDQMKAIKLVKSKVTDINRMKIEEQKKAVRSGYDMDIIPSDLMTYGNEAKRLLEDLQSRNERMFLVTVLFLNTAKSRQELDNVIFQTSGIAQKYNCVLRRLDYQQEQGLMSSIPLGLNQIPIKRALTTTSTAIFVPFTTQELFMEGEYYPLVHALGGQVIHIAPTSHDYINPMDINLDYSDDDNPLGFKSDFILSLCELIMGSRNGIEAEEKSVIDRCLPIVYQKYFENPVPENMPVLGDLYTTLRAQTEVQAQRIATALEIYVNGSLKVFNHRTNVQLDNRIVCFDIKDLGKQLKKLGMLIVQDQVWNRVTLNRFSHKSTRYYVDEFHLLLKEEQTAAYSVEIWKRFRKWGGIPTGITQNIKDLLASREIENIFENSDFIYMLNQASGDRQILAKQLNISPYQLSYVTNSGEGEGLLFYGNIIIPFKDRFNKNLKLYSLMTTKPEEVEKRKAEEAKEAEAIAAFQRRLDAWEPAKLTVEPFLEMEDPIKDSSDREESPVIPSEDQETGITDPRTKKPFVWTPGKLEDEDYWLDADIPEEPLDEEHPGKRVIPPADDDDDFEPVVIPDRKNGGNT